MMQALPKVRCKFCGFTTYEIREESLHTVDESIDRIDCDPNVKKILRIIQKNFHVCIDDAEQIFSDVMSAFEEKKKFVVLDCMEIIPLNKDNII